MTDSNVRATSSSGVGAGSGMPIAISSTSATITLPSGLSVNDPLIIPVASSFGITVGVVTPPTGWSFKIAQTAQGSGSFFVLERTGGWQTADGTSLVIPLSGVTSGILWAWVAIGMKGSLITAYGTHGTVTVKGATSVDTVAPADAGTSTQDHVVIFFGKHSAQNGTPTVAPNATVIVAVETTGTSSPDVWVGSYTGVTPATQTITHSVTTANGAGVQIPLTAVVSNVAPVANAGPDQIDIEPASTVSLTGSGSTDSDGTVVSYLWTPPAGITLSSNTSATATFTAPSTPTGGTYVFGLVVTDDDGATSSSDSVSVTVLPHTMFRLNSPITPIRMVQL